MSKHQIQPEYGNEQVDAGRKYRNPSHETKFSGANGDREIFISPVQLTSSRIGNLIRLIIILLYIVRSTVVQYGLLSVLGRLLEPKPYTCTTTSHFWQNWQRLPLSFSTTGTVYTASLPRPLQPMRTTSGALPAAQAPRKTRTGCRNVCKSFCTLVFKHYRPRRLGEIRSWVDLPSTLDAGTTAILALFSLRRLHVL